MIEIWLFGWLVATLPSGLSLVLLLVALTSVTFLATTLAPVLGAGGKGAWGARALGIASAVGALGAGLLGLRVGGLGTGGELIPTLAVSVAMAASCGASAAFAALCTRAAVARLGASQVKRHVALAGVRTRETRQLEASRRAFFAGEDLLAEVADAEASLARLGVALDKLDVTHRVVLERLEALDGAGHAGDLGRELRRTRDEVATKLDLGRRILGAAAAAAFRLSCSATLRGLLRRRPHDVTQGITPSAGTAAATTAALAMVASLDDFLVDVERARGTLQGLSSRRPPRSDHEDPDDDPQALAMQDLEAIETAYTAVRDRLAVVVVRLGARADMEAVASAAGEVSHKARAAGIPASDLQELVSEVARAETAILLVTPAELDGRSLTDALSRSAAALGGNDGASLDALLRALHELA
jgi:hypothetical protein